MDYIGEHLLPGQLGQFFIILSLVVSLAAALAYFKSTTSAIVTEKMRWKKFARILFLIEVFSVISIFGILFYIISNHLFEYKYAWQHSSISLETKYLLACFWEGQEGSFLLWSVWHCVLGLILIKSAKTWEAPVMTIVSIAQFFLATMIAGIYIFGHKIGSSPFVLLRNEMDAPIFLRPNYLSFINDGNDLNPLLQNYWMVIHPPVLFMGFASVIIPFAYAIAGLWTKKYGDWTRPALPWALFSAAILGLGIMMGAMWAYESLTFGGYWAWDPVENASLVPWLILIAGIHTLLIFKHTGHSLKATLFFFIISFLLILYSTFLTRSGILGNSSVHAFTDLGMTTQLLIFLLLFVIPSLFLFFARYKHIPQIKKEEQTSSREFWMFIGSLVFFISALSILAMTSIPVINKIAGFFTGHDEKLFTPLAIGEDSEYSYNRIQIFVAIIIGLFSAVVQYLKYKQTGSKYLIRNVLRPTWIAALVAALILIFGDINYDEEGTPYMILIWIAVLSSTYAIVANVSYIWIGLKGKLKLSGGSVAHAGFGLMLLGILISSSKKEILSFNTSGIVVSLGEGSDEKPGENLTLIKDVKTSMGKYWVTYKGDSANPDKPLWYFNIKFERKDGKEDFTLTPNAFINYQGNEGLIANPDAKHYWDRDVFTYVTSLPDPTKRQDTAQFKIVNKKTGDTVSYSNGSFVIEKLVSQSNIPASGLNPGDVASMATIRVFAKSGVIYIAEPILISSKGQTLSLPDSLTAANLIFQLNKVEGENIEMGVKETDPVIEYVTLKAYKFPFINLLWMGTFIMVAGLIISAINRITIYKSLRVYKKTNEKVPRQY